MWPTDAYVFKRLRQQNENSWIHWCFSNPWAGVTSVDVDIHSQRVTVTGNVTPAEVLRTARKKESRAQMWMGDSPYTSSHQSIPGHSSGGYSSVPSWNGMVYTNWNGWISKWSPCCCCSVVGHVALGSRDTLNSLQGCGQSVLKDCFQPGLGGRNLLPRPWQADRRGNLEQACLLASLECTYLLLHCKSWGELCKICVH